jgi:FkbM family methyltransferase
MTLRRDRATGLMYRPIDKVIVDEVKGVYGPMPVEPDDVVLDLGAHIGATSLMALAKGASHVIAVEADPGNVPLLRRNLHRKAATVIWAAVGAKPGRTMFYVRKDRPYLGSTLEDPSREPLSVPMVPLSGLLSTYRPTIVKCDIEFGEYDLAELRSLPPSVRVLAMEVHIRYAGIFASRRQTAKQLTDRRAMAADLIAAVEAQGFREVRRKDKQAKPTETPAEPDETGLPPMTKAVDAVWAR